MRKLLSVVVLATAAFAVLGLGTASADGVTCTSVSTSKGTLTAAQVGGNVTGTLDATGCDIGVYYSASTLPGRVSGADISGATLYGVFVDGTRVDVTDSQVSNIGDQPTHTGAQHGNAIYYWNGASGTISGNQVSDYQKGGIIVNGAGTSATVTHNTVTGLKTSVIAQNGIQFGYGATGSANNNSVDSNWYTGANWSSTGILVFEADGVSVSHNTVANSQTGIDAETWCYFGVPSASNNSFSNNTVSGADYGISVAAYSFYSSCDAVADNNKITNNVITGTGDPGSTGVFVGSAVVTGSYSPTVTNTKVIHNAVSAFETSYDLGSSTGTKAHADTPIP